MAITFGDRLKHAWNAFNGRDPHQYFRRDIGTSYAYRPDRQRFNLGTERSIIASAYTKLAMDVASVKIMHVRQDQNGRFLEEIPSKLDKCLTLEANLDQSGRAFIQDVAASMFDEGCVAIVPVEASVDITKTDSYQIEKLRVGKIVEWYPKYIRVSVYNERTGEKEELLMPKRVCAIVENPFYSIMNEQNSILQRLIRKMNQLDVVDDQISSGKLDLIIQLPYVVKNKLREDAAEERRKQIEMQLVGSKYGIAYIDGTERITQLNRPAENNFLEQIKYLTSMLFNQLGMTEEIFNGTADEATTLNYFNRSIEPCLAAITDAMNRAFLTQTARTQGQRIIYLRDPFKLVPVSQISEIADKFTRNEILSPNEIRAIVGYKPVDDPAADELRNRNLNQQLPEEGKSGNPVVKEGDEGQNGR